MANPFKVIRRVELIKGGFTIKQGEIFTLGFQLYDSDGVIIVPTVDQSISVKIANLTGVIYETNATVVENHIEFTVDENLGYGQMNVELKVTEGTTLIQKYPADDFIKLKITKSLDDANVGNITAISAEQMRNEITAIEVIAGDAKTTAEGAVLTAESAEEIALDTQGQLDAVVNRETDSDAMSRQAAFNAAGVDKGNLKVRLDEDFNSVSSQLAEMDNEKASKTELANVLDGTPKGTYATLAALQAAFPTGTTGVYIVTANGHIYSWSGSAWVDRGLYQAVGIAENSVGLKEISFEPILGNKGKNLFNKNTATEGFYVTSNSGILMANADYSVSEYIEILPNEAYAISLLEQIAFYDSSEAYISGLSGSPNSWTTFVTPSNAELVRLTVINAAKDTFQLERGTVLTTYEEYGNRLKENVVDTGNLKDGSVSVEKIGFDILALVKNSKPKTIEEIGEDISSPFERSNIKFIGDSITAGVGGTGYSLTGEAIGGTFFGTQQYANADTAVSMPNMLRNYINANIAKEYAIPMNDNRIKYERSYDISLDAGTASKTNLYLPNATSRRESFSFKFFGESFSVYYSQGEHTGIAEIEVDGVIYEMDTKIVRANGEFIISELTDSEHTVKVYETTRTNGTGQAVFIGGIKLTKIARVKNWGVAGINSLAVYTNIEELVEVDDDIVFIQIGTNDRIDYGDTRRTIHYLNFICDHLLGLGKDVIFMVANPVVTEDLPVKMHDIARAVKTVTDSHDMEYLSNYQAFTNYSTYTGSFADLLSDGVHPNDAGYRFTYRNIMNEFKLPIDTSN